MHADSSDSLLLAMGFPYFKQIGDGLRRVRCVSLRAFHLVCLAGSSWDLYFVSSTVKREVVVSSLVDLACN